MSQICYMPIGIVRSPFKQIGGMPVQPEGARGVSGTIEMDPAYVSGLKDLGGFSHLILLYHFHLSEGYSLVVKPFLDDIHHGVFATRAPRRPNSIGISVVRLTGVEGHILHIEDVDIVDGTPLLDIKPYVPELDAHRAEKIGWFEGRVQRVGETRADERFK